ncbi:MAG: universal stress protein [Deltaproteobacteria bacterium]|nr:universal stress protein [Deltaproteobacteria bacterium]
MTARQKPKRILLPLDGSERSLGTVRYIAKIKPFYQMQVVLFHVHAGSPESYFDLGKDPRSTGTVAYVRAWEIEQKKKARDFMEKAGGILLRVGFPEEAVSVKIQKRKQGIARDIIKEAQQDYHAVVARRRGLGALRGIVLGSVANKLLEKLDFLPFLLAGRTAFGNRILVAFDGSPGAMQAVKFVGATLGSTYFKICLVHVIRGSLEAKRGYQRLSSPMDFIENAGIDIGPRIEEARKVLLQSGFKENRISTKIITGVLSRAAAIVKEARQENYDTIVLGRRGLSQVRTFFIGRVTNKVIHMARERTVWVIR